MAERFVFGFVVSVDALEGLVGSVAEPLGMIHMAHTYYLPNDSFGRWNPALEALGLDRLSALWGAANCAFPWPRERKPGSDWPCITEISPPDLNEISQELASGWRTKLAALPDSGLADDASGAEYARIELSEGISQLAGWVEQAKGLRASERRCVESTGNSLALVMDGSQ